ncbi:MAG: hypothetical protein U0930_12135 [Pirellulales bacterium]
MNEELTNENTSYPGSGRLARARMIDRVLWLVQLLVIASLFGWLTLDGYLDRIQLGFRPTILSNQIPESISTPRVAGLWTLCGIFAVTWWGALLSLSFGRWKSTGIKPLFLLTFTMASWLAILVNWSPIVEAGRQWRLQTELKGLRSFAAELDQHWTEIVSDQAATRLPQFNAYPIESPTLLLFLGNHKVPGTQIEYCAIERSEPKVIRIELTGSNTDWWIEVRPDGTRPTQFIGGLNERFSQRKARQLDRQIYLVQYLVQEL